MLSAPSFQTAHELIDFITRSPTPFHAVHNACNLLKNAGYSNIQQNDEALSAGQYYFTQNDSSLIAISVAAPLNTGFHIIGAHTDSPGLKIKPNAIYESQGYIQLGVEVYGGALLTPWFDRDLSLAGRLTVIDNKGVMHNRLIDFKRPIGTIPSLAIHLNRNVNDENKINKQTHLPPVLNISSTALDFQGLLLTQLKQEYPLEKFESVLAYELSLYDSQAPALIGLEQNLIASARLDNLLSSFVGLRALLNHHANTNCVLVLNDHEEVGSQSAEGASGPFLASALRQLCGDDKTYRSALNHSVLLSVDNAHAVHPNYADQHEPRHQPKINHGPVIKTNHNQRYATNSETHALFAHICQQAQVPFQQFVVRSDMGCGSTIGPITAASLGVHAIDIGAPQLAMHSIRELAGALDCEYLLTALTAFLDLANMQVSPLPSA